MSKPVVVKTIFGDVDDYAMLDRQKERLRSQGQISVKNGDRNPAPSRMHRFPRPHEFCVCRVVGDCALTTIESFDKLLTAKRYMKHMAVRVPGSYVVFSQASRQVLGKAVCRANG
jgi:hypothetical protein